MATRHAYLEGGPCDGETRKITPAIGDTGVIICKNHKYQTAYPSRHHGGSIVFIDLGAVPVTPPPSIGKNAKLHKGFADLQHSVNRNLPKSLKAAERSVSAGLRSIARARKVRL